MDEQELRKRTKRFALDVMRFTDSLPRKRTTEVIGKQLVRCARLGANYRAACRARSKPDFIAKLGIVLEEVDESLYWMELLQESQTVPLESLRPLAKEANELVSIVAASIVTVKRTAKVNLKSQI